MLEHDIKVEFEQDKICVHFHYCEVELWFGGGRREK